MRRTDVKAGFVLAFEVAFLALCGLKLAGVPPLADLAWLWVLAPIWAPFGVLACVHVFLLAVSAGLAAASKLLDKATRVLAGRKGADDGKTDS